MEKSVLLINDLAGVGKVALGAMLPVLSAMGYRVSTLPTALVSNTLDYGRFQILETTDYMRSTMGIWDELGFSFDAVAVGFLVSEEQACLTADYCQRKKQQGAAVFVDPIMGDEGKLYPGVSRQTIQYMRKMCASAKVILPNLTEAVFLADKYQDKASLSAPETADLLETLHRMGAESVVVTSARVDGTAATLVYDGTDNGFSVLPYQELPARFPGTGDLFAAIVVGRTLKGEGLVSAVQAAMRAVSSLMARHLDEKDKFCGLPIEQHLKEIVK